MKRRIAITLAGAALASATLAVTPPGAPIYSPLLLALGAAPVTKSLEGGGGGNIGGAGERLAGVLAGWGVPVVIALAGLLLIGALSARNIGACIGIGLITLVSLIFLLSPTAIESAAKGIAAIVF
jgi:hypothetical protein